MKLITRALAYELLVSVCTPLEIMDKITCHKHLGQAGESFAVDWLIEKGYQIIKQNYHAPGGEIDIIAWCPREKFCLMVEVKTRSHDGGLAAINSQKVRRMKRAAEHYFFVYLKRQYAPDFELWGLAIERKGKTLSVVDWQAL